MNCKHCLRHTQACLLHLSPGQCRHLTRNNRGSRDEARRPWIISIAGNACTGWSSVQKMCRRVGGLGLRAVCSTGGLFEERVTKFDPALLHRMLCDHWLRISIASWPHERGWPVRRPRRSAIFINERAVRWLQPTSPEQVRADVPHNKEGGKGGGLL